MRTMSVLLATMTLTLGCDGGEIPACSVVCSSDADCPSGQACTDLGLCSTSDTCSCTPGEFIACNSESAVFCNAAANGVEKQECGAAGCNATASRCNSCVPSSASCSADATKLDHCDADGLPAASDECRLGCVAASSTTSAHCGHIQPMFLPDVCDVPATMPELMLSNATLETSSDATCNGGIATQTMGPEICIVRYGTIHLATGTIKVRGTRALALVADGALVVESTFDASADGTANGPGGGTVISGTAANSNRGGGGAGFKVSGGAGGFNVDGGGGAGGEALDPLANPARLIGGPRPARFIQEPTTAAYAEGGGGGGAVTMISCRGAVSVAGVIDVGGGGGGPGNDTFPAIVAAGAVNFSGGGGGGAGGYVAIQAADVRVTGLGMFANGGGGGGGCSTDECIGTPGQDAARFTAAQGGTPLGTGGRGGNGGTGQPPTVGLASSQSPGGGGGAAGRLQLFIPDRGTVMAVPTSPPLEANRTVPIR